MYSLTPWDDRNFLGGETTLFAEEPWQKDIGSPKATHGFYDLIPAQFNQLLVFDDRVPHAVPRIEGTMDPLRGRVVLHGHISETALTIEGGLTAAEINPVMQQALTEASRRRARLNRYFHGLLVVRLFIAPEGDTRLAGCCSIESSR